MNIFDDGCHQAILDAARQPIDKSSDGYVEGFSASDDTTQARRLELASGRTTKARAARRIIHFEPQISHPAQIKPLRAKEDWPVL